MTPAQIARLKELDAARTRDLGPWLFEAATPGYITTIFGQYLSEEAAGIAYTVNGAGNIDQQNADAEFICTLANAAPALIEAVEEVEKLREELRALCRAYVSLLEAGADCIASLGGACDPVSVMEARDHALRRARAALQGSAPEQKEQA